MSPTKRASTVDALRRGVGQVQHATPAPAVPPAAAPATEPKARVTLNLPAPVYRDIERWTIEAAGSLGVPRVSIQNALRAMIRACLDDPQAKDSAVGRLRSEGN